MLGLVYSRTYDTDEELSAISSDPNKQGVVHDVAGSKEGAVWGDCTRQYCGSVGRHEQGLGDTVLQQVAV